MVILEVVQKAKGLLLTVAALILLNLGLFIVSGMSNDGIVQNFGKYLALTVGGFVLVSLLWRRSKKRDGLQKLWVFYRVLSLVTWLMDIGIAQGFLVSKEFHVMLVAQVVVFLVYLRILEVYDRMLDEGDDYLLTEDIRPRLDRARNQSNAVLRIIQKSIVWIICTFWVGSDVLTLLFRKGEKTTAKDIMLITLPSSVVGTAGITSAIGLIMKAVGILT